jgi:hypothetical protein
MLPYVYYTKRAIGIKTLWSLQQWCAGQFNNQIKLCYLAFASFHGTNTPQEMILRDQQEGQH